jgi:hypothetical protein
MFWPTECIDFGVQACSNKTVSKNLKIMNKGALAGQFSIDYRGSLPLSFAPQSKIVQPYSSINIKVSFFSVDLNLKLFYKKKIQFVMLLLRLTYSQAMLD